MKEDVRVCKLNSAVTEIIKKMLRCRLFRLIKSASEPLAFGLGLSLTPSLSRCQAFQQNGLISSLRQAAYFASCPPCFVYVFCMHWAVPGILARHQYS